MSEANRLRIRPAASNDLVETIRFLDFESETAGDNFIEEFFKSAELLAEHPGAGALRRARGRLKGLRSWPLKIFRSYVIFYMPLSQGGVEIVRVLHGARNVDRELRKQ